jgi:hypothetical protein
MLALLFFSSFLPLSTSLTFSHFLLSIRLSIFLSSIHIGMFTTHLPLDIVGIMLHLMVLYLAIYTISCVGNEACPTQESRNTLYQVPENSCSCNPNTSGTLRYYDNKLQICDGEQFVGVGDSRHEFGSEEKPAKSCNEIAEKQR